MTTTEQFALWRAEMKAPNSVDRDPSQGDISKMISGYWRIIGAKTKPDYPVAIMLSEDESATVFQIGRKRPMNSVEHDTEWHEFLGGSWLKCQAVSKADWTHALEQGRWPDGKPSRQLSDEEKAGIAGGTEGNQPPKEEALADQIKTLAAALDATKEPTTQEEANKLSEKLERMRGLLKLAEAERVQEKEPHLQASREVDARWKDIKAPGEKAGIEAEARRKSYLRRRQAELDAIAAEEERQRREAARAEQEAERTRLAEEESARRRAEAEAAGFTAEEVDQVAQVAPEEIPLPEPEVAPVEAERAVAGGAYGRASGLRKVRVAVVEDPTKLAAHFIEGKDEDFAAYLQKRAAAAVRAKVSLPGVGSREELQ